MGGLYPQPMAMDAIPHPVYILEIGLRKAVNNVKAFLCEQLSTVISKKQIFQGGKEGERRNLMESDPRWSWLFPRVSEDVNVMAQSC